MDVGRTASKPTFDPPSTEGATARSLETRPRRLIALLWAGAVTVATSILLSAWYFVSLERARTEAAVGETLLRLTATLAANAESVLAEAERRLVQASAALAWMVPEHAAIVGVRRAPGEGVAESEEPAVVVFVASDGQGMAPIPALGQSFSDRSEVAMALKAEPGEVTWGPVRYSERLGTYILPLSQRLAPNPHDAAVAVSAVPLPLLLGVLASAQLPLNGAVALMYEDGSFIARLPFDPRILGRRFSGPAVQGFQRADVGVVAGPVQTDGADRIIAFHRVGSRPVFALVATGREELLGLGRTRELLVFAFAGVLAGGLLFGAAATSRQFRRDSQRLVEIRRAREEAERVAATLREMGAAIAVTDGEGRLSWANRAFFGLTGLRDDDFGGRAIFTLLVDHEAQPEPQPHTRLRAAIRDAQPCDEVLQLRKMDGAPFWARCVGAPLSARLETHERYVLVLADVTEEMRAREAAVRAERLSALGRLAGSVAHDTNNLLAIVALHLEVLAETPLSREQRELVDAALGAAQRGADLTRPLLAFAQRSIDAPRTIDLTATLEKLVPLLVKAMPNRIALVTELGSLGRGRADEGGLESAVTNLVLNARDAIGDQRDGRIVLSCRRVSLDGPAARRLGLVPGPYAALVVEDDGPGMPPEVLEHVLEPFFTTKGDRGSGLGLPSAYGFARQSGGTLEIESTPGAGTRVTIYLPLVDGTEPAAPDGTAVGTDASLSLRDRTVLVVEDDPQALLGLQRLLEAQGAQVFGALDEDQALARVAVSSPDLLVLDIKLGHGANGLDLARRIRRFLPKVPIVFVTGDPGLDFEARIAALDMVTVVQKPFRRDTLLAAMAAVMRQGTVVARDVETEPLCEARR